MVPSLYEGFSLPAVEAMACGVPLVATTGGALPEVAGPSGVTALLVPPNDPGALAQAMLAALADERVVPPTRVRRQEADHRAFHLAGVTARGTVEQYRELLGGRPGRSVVLTVDFGRLGLRPGDRVLDLGCGAGRHAFECLRRGAVVIALDADPVEVKGVIGLMAAMAEAGEVPAGWGGGGGEG